MASDFSATLIPDSSGTVISVVLMWVKKDICTYKYKHGLHIYYRKQFCLLTIKLTKFSLSNIQLLQDSIIWND